MLLAFVPADVQADESPAAETTVSGLLTKRNTSYKKTTPMTDTVTVNNAYGRTAQLQAYNYDTREYETKSTYRLDDAQTSTVQLTYDNSWKPYYYSAWRLVIPEDGQYSGYSQKIKVYNTFMSCKTAAVLDAETGEIVFNKNSTVRREPASMTKIMTTILLLENKSLSARIKITQEADNTPWGIGIAKGDTLTVRQAVYCMLLPSANDVACASGIAVSGSTAKFAAAMTAKAKSLGCTKTNFKNAHGLHSSGHYTTAYDMGLIMRYAVTGMTQTRTDFVKKVLADEKYSFRSGNSKKYTAVSTDELLGEDEFLGGKTGYTEEAGYCFTGVFTYGGRTYISVVMGAGSVAGRFSETEKLMAFTKYAVDNSCATHTRAK
jgi:D-alanyl-D-alanine carboxypeptidase